MASKIILAFDTSSSACSVALQIEDCIYSAHKISPMGQAKWILPMIHQLLDEHALKLQQIDMIAYGCGPGSFTGSRIGCSVAQGLAYSAQCLLTPISSLSVIAQSAYLSKKWAESLVVLDAGAGEIYLGAYQLNKHDCVRLDGKELIGKPEEIALQIPESASWYGVGEGWQKYGETLLSHMKNRPIQIDFTQLPSAEALISLANDALSQNTSLINPFEAIPVYLR